MMKQYIRIFLLISLTAFAVSSAKAQNRNYSLMSSKADWTRIGLNASYIPEKDTKLIIAVPLLSQMNMGANIPFWKSNIIEQNDKKLTINFNELLNSLGGNELSASLDMNLLGVGFKVKKHFFSINVALHGFGCSFLDDSLTEFIANGNGKYLGKTVHTKFMNTNISAWAETNLGFATSLMDEDRLRIGGRLKVLFGLASAQMKNSKLDLTTSELGDRLDMVMESEINLAMPVEFTGYENGRLDFDKDFVNTDNIDYKPFDNMGFGIDLGAEYDLNKQFTFGLAVNNLSFIDWGEKYANTIKINVGENDPVSFDGFNLRNELINKEVQAGEEKESAIDKSKDALERQSEVKSANAFRLLLPTIYNLTVAYKPLKTLSVKALAGLLDRHDGNGLAYDFALLGHYQPASWFSISVNVAKTDNNPLYLGSAIVLGDGLQFVIGSDNILSKLGANAYLGLNVRI